MPNRKVNGRQNYKCGRSGSGDAPPGLGLGSRSRSALLASRSGPKVLIGLYDHAKECTNLQCEHRDRGPSVVIVDALKSKSLSPQDCTRIDQLFKDMRSAEPFYGDQSPFHAISLACADDGKDYTRKWLETEVEKRVTGLLATYNMGKDGAAREMTYEWMSDADWKEVHARDSGSAWTKDQRAYLICPAVGPPSAESTAGRLPGYAGLRAPASEDRPTYNAPSTCATPVLGGTTARSATDRGHTVHIGCRLHTLTYMCGNSRCPLSDTGHTWVVPALAIIDGTRQLSSEDHARIDSLADTLRKMEPMYKQYDETHEDIETAYENNGKKIAAEELLKAVDALVQDLLNEDGSTKQRDTFTAGRMSGEDWREIETRDAGGNWGGGERSYVVLPQLQVQVSDETYIKPECIAKTGSEGRRSRQVEL